MQSRSYLGHLVSGASILPLTDQIEVFMKLLCPANIKEVRHFHSLRGYYRKFICNYSDIAHPLNCLTCKSLPFTWTPHCQSSFDMLCSQLTNMPIVQLPDPNKPYLLFIDVRKVCYSGVLTQKPPLTRQMKHSKKLLTDKDPLKSVESQAQDLQLKSNIVHPVAYISGSFTENQCRWPAITEECLGIFMSIKSVPFTYKMQIY